MTYEELTALQYGRSKSFADAQTEAMSTYGQAEHDLKQLQAENTKLRELVRAMWLYDYAGKFSSAQDDVEHVAMVYRCMRELGVEI